MPLAGRPLVEWSLAALRAAPSVRSIVVACPPGTRLPSSGRSFLRIAEETATATAGGGAWEGVVTVEGGATRSQSVANALEGVATELVAIHDAARPLLTPALVEGVVATLLSDPGAAGAIAATPVTDTIKRAKPESHPKPESDPGPESDPKPESHLGPESDPGRMLLHFPHARGENAATEIGATLDRRQLWAAQTPQAFRVEALRRALEASPEAVEAATDEAMLVEAVGGRVLIHPAPAENLKVTTPLDLRLAELLLA